MYLETKRFSIDNEHVDELVAKWSGRDASHIDGLQSLQVFVDDKEKREEREVMIQLTWESFEKMKAWRVHPDHIAGHKNGKTRPDWIKKVESKGYFLK